MPRHLSLPNAAPSSSSRRKALPAGLACGAILAAVLALATSAQADGPASVNGEIYGANRIEGATAFVEMRCRSEGDRAIRRLDLPTYVTRTRLFTSSCGDAYGYAEIALPDGRQLSCRTFSGPGTRIDIQFTADPGRECRIERIQRP